MTVSYISAKEVGTAELSNAQVAGQFLLTLYVTKGGPVMKMKF
jgi:hypothetical protein